MIHTMGRSDSYKTTRVSQLVERMGFSAYINQDWRYKWQQYRILAEHARYAELFIKIAGYQTKFEEQDWPKSTHSEFKTWFAAEQLKGRKINDGLLAEHLHQLVKDQIAYHEKTIDRLGLIAHRLHGLASLSFIATGVVCLGHLVIHHPFLSCLAALLPALGASCHGVLATGEYTRLLAQSEQTINELKKFQSEFLERKVLWNSAGPAQSVMKFFNIVTADCEDWHRTLVHADVPKA